MPAALDRGDNSIGSSLTFRGFRISSRLEFGAACGGWTWGNGFVKQFKRTFWRLGFAVAVLFASATFAPAQTIRNGDFDESISWWFAFGGGDVSETDTGYQSEIACLVSRRGESWHGAAQDIQGIFEPGQDYHIEAYIRPEPGKAGTMRVRVYQSDDRGDRVVEIGEAECLADQWTRIQGGFTYDPNGDVGALNLVFNNSEDDGQKFDFIIDAVKVTVNDWRDAADARIEEIRKRNVELNFVRSNGLPASGLSISIAQVSHAFPFGSALNDRFDTNETYRDFFMEHFDAATIEWFAQWKPVEVALGTEDYSIADSSVEFCLKNGIQLKGHALFWADERFRPTWLDDLGNDQLLQEMEQRITNAVSRYQQRLFGWDVANEMLNFEYFEERLGPDIRSWMFKKAREIDPQTKLFLNEYGVETSEAKAKRYRQLVDSLQVEGAIIDGVGFQSHFDGLVSPKGIEIAMEQFRDSGIGIWFTEFDAVHPDPVSRAKALEDFYRYAFSCPEAKGITMWGFWAGSHWLGADASIVDQDWTVNEAGQRYFDLMDQWTTETEGSSSGSGEFDFRGFLGSYLVSTTDARGTVNHHLVPVNEGEGAFDTTLVANPFDESLSVYGTSEDDVFEFDLAVPDVVWINGAATNLALRVETADVRFVGLGGNDQVKVYASIRAQNLLANQRRLIVRDPALTVRFEGMENVEILAADIDSRITLVDSGGDDVYESFPDISTLSSESTKLIVSGFGQVVAYSNFGNDVANLFDGPSVDKFATDLNFVNVKDENTIRQTIGFSQTVVESSAGLDTLEVRVGQEEKSIDVAPLSIDFSIPAEPAAGAESVAKQMQFLGMRNATFIVDTVNKETVNILGGEQSETIRIAPNGSVYYGEGFRYVFDRDFNNFESLVDTPGEDRLIYRDTAGDEFLSCNGESCVVEGDGFQHTFQFLDVVIAFSRAGGIDTAEISSPSANVRLFGDWNEGQ